MGHGIRNNTVNISFGNSLVLPIVHEFDFPSLTIPIVVEYETHDGQWLDADIGEYRVASARKSLRTVRHHIAQDALNKHNFLMHFKLSFFELCFLLKNIQSNEL